MRGVIRFFSRLSGLFTLAILAGVLSLFLVWHPDSPLPAEWNPAEPLDLGLPLTPVARWKLARAHEGQACFDALDSIGAEFDILEDLEAGEQCHIRDRLRLTDLHEAGIAPLITRCTIALKLALWMKYGLEPAAEGILGESIARLHHLDSYNCREIRTPSGRSGRMSTHATADAVDITGVTLSDGQHLRLIEDWGQGEAGDFLKAARDTSCRWFATTLGPDYNSLHRDHFHLQSRGWGLCR